MRYLLTIGVALILMTGVSGQTSVDYTDADKHAFVQVFWQLKEFRTVHLAKLESEVTEIGLTAARRDSLHSRRDAHALTAADSVLIRRISKMEMQFGWMLDNKKKTLCEASGITADAFNAILFQYRTDIAFQRSLKPFFDAYFDEHR